MTISRCADCPLQDRRICGRDRGTTREALIALVGSTPRSYEIKRGIAFAGQGGKVLRESLARMDVPLDRCMFTHAIRCQTPRGRKAKVEEIRACAPELHRRVLDAEPRIIVAMGDDAIKSFIDTPRAASTIRGHVGEFHGIPVMPTIDPHKVVRVNPRFAAEDEKHDASGSPDAFPDLYRDLERAVGYALHDRTLVEEIPYDNYYLAHHERHIEAVIRRLNELPPGTVIAADVETSSLDYRTGEILTLALTWAEGTGVGIVWMGRADIISKLANALRPHKLIFHNGFYDVPWLRHSGADVRWDGDTMLLHYLVDERVGTHGLERLAIDYLGWPPYESALKEKFRVGSAAANDAEASYANVDMDDLLAYNVADTDATLRLWNRLTEEAEEEEVRHLHDDLLVPAAEHFLRLERDGMLVDYEYHRQLGERWRSEMKALEKEMRAYEGAESINLNSTKQVAAFLYDTLGLEQMPANEGEYVDPDLVLELTDSVEDEEAQEYFRVASSAIFMKLKPRSTNTYMLWWLADQHPWPKALVRHRVIGTRHRTYYEGIKQRLGWDGRIRPRFRLHGTRTGRLSSTDPNIHGIARNNEVKNIFVADPGYTLIAADYSQAEVRMMAHFAQDEKLVRALSESDIHRAISRFLFKVTEEELQAMDPERVKFLRRAAKTIIFGLIYGRSAKSLAPQLGLSLTETNRYIYDLFKMMPAVPRFIRTQQKRVLREQEAVSLFGRKRRFPLVLKANVSETKRKGVNMPIQSSVSDMTLMANLEVLRRLDEYGASPRVWPHIHDGFLFQVPDDRVEQAIEVTKDVMLNPSFETEVHFAAEIEAGKRWGEMAKVFEG